LSTGGEWGGDNPEKLKKLDEGYYRPYGKFRKST